MNQFSTLGLSQAVCDVLDQLGFHNPMPIQKEAIPLLLSKNPTDFIGLAQTGTGKTAAFGLPLIDLIETGNSNVQALIMAPTRELGLQTAKQLVQFSNARKGLNVEVVYGGANIVAQIKALKKPTQIVVATPGRLLDLIKRKAINLEFVKYVILDEADEMLNMGFKEDIDLILDYTDKEKSIWLFSATMPSEIRRIVKKYMSDQLEVSVNSEEKSNKDIDHQFVVTTTANKIPALRRFLEMQPDMRGIMFCRTKRETQQIADQLTNLDYNVEALHGDLSQAQREAVMRRFKNRSMQLLIATDVAARGIDVNDLTHVIQHTLPDQLESYTHRSGRTGRAGKKGISLVFINPRENRKISDLEKKLNISFTKVEVPSKDSLVTERISHWAEVVANIREDEKSNDLLNVVRHKFEDLSKEQLLKRLITTQLDHIGIQNEENDDLNESHRKQEKSNTSNGDLDRYFINLGSIDGLTSGDLIHLISDISGINRKNLGDLEMKKNCSFFYVNKDAANGISTKFKGLEVEGRSIRVNRDDEPGNSGGGSFGKERKKGRSRGPSRNKDRGKRVRRRN
ncbi:MAG: DEAD/DEAH box helicase [Cytophagales bacterium]